MGVNLNIDQLTKDDDFLDFLEYGERTPMTMDVIGTIPKGDFRHLSEKITKELSWWTSARIESKTFRKEFDVKNSLFFINCGGLIVGFFYPSQGCRIRYFYAVEWRGTEWWLNEMEHRYLYLPEEVEEDTRTMTLPSTWCSIDPLKIEEVFGHDKHGKPKRMQGLKTMPSFTITVLEQKESRERVRLWTKDKRINPKAGRWFAEDMRLKEQREEYNISDNTMAMKKSVFSR